MLFRSDGSPGPDLATRGAGPHSLLDHPVPVERPGPALRLPGGSGGGPGEGVEPPPRPDDNRLHLLHGPR